MTERKRSGLSDMAVRKTAEKLAEAMWAQIKICCDTLTVADPNGDRQLIARGYDVITNVSRQKSPHAIGDYDKVYAAENMIRHLSSYDPTPNGIYTRWIAARYAAGDFCFFEDVYKIEEPLELYQALKPQLPIDKRNIDHFKTFQEFDSYMGQFHGVETESQRAAGRRREAEMLENGEAELLHDDDEIKIVIPRTIEASIHFGRNTKWCTAARKAKNNMFDYYQQRGDLIIILLKNENRRWQFHFEDGQFMDEEDDDADIGGMIDQYPWVLQHFRGRFVANGQAVEHIPDLTVDEMLTLVCRDGLNLAYFDGPPELIIRAAVRQSSYALQYPVARTVFDDAFIAEVIVKTPTVLAHSGFPRVPLTKEQQIDIAERYPRFVTHYRDACAEAVKVCAWINQDIFKRAGWRHNYEHVGLRDFFETIPHPRFDEPHWKRHREYKFDGPYPDFEGYEPSAEVLRLRDESDAIFKRVGIVQKSADAPSFGRMSQWMDAYQAVPSLPSLSYKARGRAWDEGKEWHFDFERGILDFESSSDFSHVVITRPNVIVIVSIPEELKS